MICDRRKGTEEQRDANRRLSSRKSARAYLQLASEVKKARATKTKTKKCRSAAGGGRRGPKQVATGAFTASRILSQAGKRPLFQVQFDFRRTQCQVIIFLVTFSSACPLAPSTSYLVNFKRYFRQTAIFCVVTISSHTATFSLFFALA